MADARRSRDENEKVIYGSDYKLDIVIYEGTEQYFMREPVKIDPKRLVLPLSMLIMLIYAISLSIRPSFKLTIHNQCLNVSLTPPVYVTGDGLECHRPPDYKVYAGDTMKSGFIIKSDNVSYGVLIYRLQRKQSHESTEIGKDTSNVVHLLVIWKIPDSKMLYADVLLIEHTEALIWNEDNLNKLYHKNRSRLKKYNDTVSYVWSMDHNTALKTTFSARVLKGNPKLSISISEEKDEHAIRPLCVDLER
jgi:hypothetical protein